MIHLYLKNVSSLFLLFSIFKRIGIEKYIQTFADADNSLPNEELFKRHYVSIYNEMYSVIAWIIRNYKGRRLMRRKSFGRVMLILIMMIGMMIFIHFIEPAISGIWLLLFSGCCDLIKLLVLCRLAVTKTGLTPKKL